MGSKKLFLMQSLKRAAALASVLGVIGGISAGFASAQTAQYQPVKLHATQASFDMPGFPVSSPQSNGFQRNGVPLPPPSYAPIPKRNSARIVGSQRLSMPHATRQATDNRRALVARGRMISAGYPQEPGALGSLRQDSDTSVLQRDDKTQDIFGGDQSIPNVPQNNIPQVPVPQNPELPKRQDGELPQDVFKNPFENENPIVPDPGSQEIPNQLFPENPGNREETPEDPGTEQNQNPFVPEETVPDDQIDYQPSRIYGTPGGRSNVYRAPGTDDALEQRDNGIYFVPAYDPIPGTHQSTMAPPAMMQPGHEYQQQMPWPDEYATPNQQPSYQPPYYQQQYPQYQQPPGQNAYPPEYSPAPGMQPDQQVYTPVVQQPNRQPSYVKGPMTTARRGLWNKLKRDCERDLGFGDYQSCQNAGNCGGCNTGCGSGCGSSCGSTCPVFYIGFQGAWNDAFDVANDQGSELLLDDGTAFFFSLGRMNGRNLRTEIELSFRDNDVSGLLTPDGEVPLTGRLQTFSGMANAYWEFVRSPTGRLKPYVGGGVGFLSATADLNFDSNPMDQGQADSSSSFAYQWIAGVNFKVSNHLDLYGEYRFLDAESFGIPSDRDDLAGDFGYSANSVGGGFRWKF